jgi:hypothetical protein
MAEAGWTFVPPPAEADGWLAALQADAEAER